MVEYFLTVSGTNKCLPSIRLVNSQTSSVGLTMICEEKLIRSQCWTRYDEKSTGTWFGHTL